MTEYRKKSDTKKNNFGGLATDRTINFPPDELYKELVLNEPYFPEISKRQTKQYGDKSCLPNVTQLINTKKINVIRMKDKEIDRLQFMNNYLQISSQKKDEVIESSRKAIIQLKDEISSSKINKKKQTLQPRYSYMEDPSKDIMKSQNQSQQSQYPGRSNMESGPKTISTNANMKSPSQTTSSQNIYFAQHNQQNARSSMASPQSENKQPFMSNRVSKQQRASQQIQQEEAFKDQIITKEDFEINLQQSNIIRIDMSDDQAMKVFQSYDHYQHLALLISEQEGFYEQMQKQTQVQLSNLHEKIRKLLSDFKLFFLLIMRLKKIIRAAFHMTSSLVLVEALQKIVDETCSCLECDRCSVFVVDEHKQELWSKVASGTNKVLRFPMNRGLAGHVAMNKEVLNIMNAYADERFNKEIDKDLNYKTKSILVVPVIDEQKRCLGVIQCINKVTGSHFTKDDEELLGMIADFSRIVLQNAINFDEQHVTHNKLRHVIQTGISLYGENSLKDFIIQAEKRLREMMYVDDARVLINDFKGNFIYYNDKQEEVTVRQGGIAEKIMRAKDFITAKNLQEDLDFNPEIDLNTNMPTISMNFTHPNFVQPLGIIQVVNIKGIGELFTKKKIRLVPAYEEILGYFLKQLAQIIVRWYENNNLYQEFKVDNPQGNLNHSEINESKQISLRLNQIAESHNSQKNCIKSSRRTGSMGSIPSNQELESFDKQQRKVDQEEAQIYKEQLKKKVEDLQNVE